MKYRSTEPPPTGKTEAQNRVSFQRSTTHQTQNQGHSVQIPLFSFRFRQPSENDNEKEEKQVF